MPLKQLTAAALLAFLATGIATAQDLNTTKDGTPSLVSVAPDGACVPIPDNTYTLPIAGTTGMVCKMIAVPPGTVNNPSIQLGVTHTWIGDLTVKVIPPSGSPSVTLYSRPGRTGGAGAGDSSNVINTSPLTFADSFTDDPETMGNTLSTSQNVCADDARCNYRTNRDEEATSATNLAALNAQAAAGNWQVCVGDGAGLDTGQLCAVTINVGTGGGGGGLTYTVIPSSHNFGNQAVGAVSATVNSVVANTSASGNVNITGCTFGGTNGTDFSFATAPTFPIAIVPAANASLGLRFTPAAAGPRTATLTCNTNATGAGATFGVTLSGTGASPLFASNPMPNAIISLQAGVGLSSNINGTINVSNAGNAPLTVTCTTTAPFSVIPSPLTVAAGSNGNLVVSFAPIQAGPINATLSCITNAAAPNNNVTYNLRGTGFDTTAVPSTDAIGRIMLLGLIAALGLFAVTRRNG